MNEDLIYRLRKRAEIRRQISTRKSVQENAPDRIADLLEEAANRIEELESKTHSLPMQVCTERLGSGLQIRAMQVRILSPTPKKL